MASGSAGGFIAAGSFLWRDGGFVAESSTADGLTAASSTVEEVARSAGSGGDGACNVERHIALSVVSTSTQVSRESRHTTLVRR